MADVQCAVQLDAMQNMRMMDRSRLNNAKMKREICDEFSTELD
jgi:hypothetical protein